MQNIPGGRWTQGQWPKYAFKKTQGEISGPQLTVTSQPSEIRSLCVRSPNCSKARLENAMRKYHASTACATSAQQLAATTMVIVKVERRLDRDGRKSLSSILNEPKLGNTLKLSCGSIKQTLETCWVLIYLGFTGHRQSLRLTLHNHSYRLSEGHMDWGQNTSKRKIWESNYKDLSYRKLSFYITPGGHLLFLKNSHWRDK